MRIKLFALLVSTLTLFAVQFATISMASADVDTDLRISGFRDFANTAIEYSVCNDGPTSIKEIVLSLESTNLEFDYIAISPFKTAPAAGYGALDTNTMTWTGILDGPVQDDLGTPDDNEYVPGECIYFVSSGEFTGDLGDTVTTSVEIVSATQVDDTVNTDTSGNESLVFDPITIEEFADLEVESLLTTAGEITETSDVSFQIDVKNTGEGVFRNNPNFFILVFILPPDATFSSFEDAELGDAIYLDENSYCDSPGTVEQVGLGSGLSAYYDRTIFICNLSVSGDGTLPADDTIYPFQVNLVAGESLAAGSADVIALIEGNDVDTITLMKTMNQGDDPLSIGSNNVAYLNYDPTELTATVNRCSGQGETTTDGTGCFTITFNKLIYVPSFTTDDFDLGGVGNVSGFNQLDDFTWRVNVSGILPGQQLTLNLRLNEIQDYSAQQNETQVLGINTIRFEAAGSAAAGTLPATGNNTSTSVLAVAMILLGVGITFASRRKALV